MAKIAGQRAIPYEERMGEDLIKHMAKGLSFESYAGILSCTEAELNSLLDRSVHFKRCYEIAMQKSRLFWEQIGIAVTLGLKTFKGADGQPISLGSFNASAWQFVMKNRFGWNEEEISKKSKQEKTIKIKLPDALKQKAIKVKKTV